MNQEEETLFEKEEERQSVRRFEEMERTKSHAYFDVHEVEQIVDFYINEGSHKHAFDAVRFGLLQHPDSISLQFKKAQVLLFQGKIKQSISLLDKISRIEYTNHEIFVSLGMAYNLMGKSGEALRNFEIALSLEPEDVDEIASQIAFSFQDQENYNEAIKYFSLALEKNPTRIACLLELGNCHKLLSKYSEAEVFYKKYLDSEPFAFVAWFFLAVVQKYQYQYDQALDSLDFSLAINDQYVNAWFLKADILLTIDLYDEAIISYLNLIALMPEDVMALVSLAQCYLHTEQTEEAERYLSIAKSIDPSYTEIYYFLGMAAQQDGRVEKSLKLFKKACSMEPKNSTFWFAYSKALSDSGLLKEARKALKNAIREEPSKLDYREALSILYSEDGRFLKAAEILEEGLSFSKPNARFLYYLGSYRILGHELKKGLQAIEEALQLNFQGHEEIKFFQPDVFNKREVLELIEKYKNLKS